MLILPAPHAEVPRPPAEALGKVLAYLDQLNPEQRAAVLHGNGAVVGPLLVIAGAGSGKTNTLAHRVAHLLVEGADPRRLLLMTFSRRAAAEMTGRVERIVRRALGDKAGGLGDAITWSGTFHAIGARLLREYAPVIGLDPSFTLHDRGDSADLMDIVRHDLGFSRTESRFPSKGTCIAIYSRAVNGRLPLEPVLAQCFPRFVQWEEELKQVFRGYVAAKQATNVMDYDDLLLFWASMMADAELAREIGGRFDHVLIDEYQDTNRLQAEILLGLKPDGRGLTVVGDDAQAIYAFRAAEIRNILDFPSQFDPPARVITLERNYRSSQPILAASNAVMAEARERFTKNLWTDRPSSERPALVTVSDEIGQAEYVCRGVLVTREEGVPLKQQAVLFRTSHHSGPLEVELTRRNIPYVKFGGLKFLEAAHVKDLLAILRFAENPRDRLAGFRVLKLLPGVGPSAAAAILDQLSGPTASLAEVVPPRRALVDWPAFLELWEALRGSTASWPADLELARLWYEPHLERVHEDAGQRRADLLAARADRPRLRLAGGVPARADARPALGDQRPRGRAAPGRRLSHSLHHPLGQGPGMGVGLHPQLHRRLHPVRHGDRHTRRDRGGAPPALRGHDAGEGRPAPDHPAPVLHPRPGRAWGPARLCGAEPVPVRAHARAVPGERLECGRSPRCERKHLGSPRPEGSDAGHVVASVIPEHRRTFDARLGPVAIR
jgi:DNA helicase II / ATP-dependent DNA helicase PcrA